MRSVKIAELKNNLSRYLDQIRAGGSVLVFDREQPVAKMVPAQGGEVADGNRDGRLERLERRGVIRRGKGGLPNWLGRPALKVQGGVIKTLLEERKSGW